MFLSRFAIWPRTALENRVVHMEAEVAAEVVVEVVEALEVSLLFYKGNSLTFCLFYAIL